MGGRSYDQRIWCFSAKRLLLTGESPEHGLGFSQGCRRPRSNGHGHTATLLVLVLGLQPTHQLVLHLLGPLYENIYTPSAETAEGGLQHLSLVNSSAVGRKLRPMPVAPQSPAPCIPALR